MESIGIVAEYNPFHNGHLYHLSESRKRTGLRPCVSVMSGSFTQRGEAAILDKWTRAAIAVKAGVDLVFELPAAFTVRSAQHFAAGAVKLLDALGVVHTLSFGAETADLTRLRQAAAAFADPDTRRALKARLKAGMSYAAALEAATRERGQAARHILSEPNNILAVEYLKAIAKVSSNIAPLAIERHAAPYHAQDITSSIASAAAIRKQLTAKAPDADALAKALPPCAYDVVAPLCLSGGAFASTRLLDCAVAAKLRTMKLDALSAIAGVSEGLEYKLADAALKGSSIDEILARAKSKRYPLSRLKRILIHTLLGTTSDQLLSFDESGPLYARVLAFNDTGRLLLKELKQASRIPVIMKTAAYLTSGARAKGGLSPLQEMLAVDTYATDLHALCHAKKERGALDFLQSPIYVR